MLDFNRKEKVSIFTLAAWMILFFGMLIYFSLLIFDWIVTTK
jgi:hypothetical protein